MVLRAAAPLTVRQLPLRLLGGSMIAVATVSGLRVANGEDVRGVVFGATVALAMVATFAVGDEAANVTASVPTPLRSRQSWRLGMVTVWLIAAWALTMIVVWVLDASSAAAAGVATPVARLVTLGGIGLSVAALACRHDVRSGGPVGSAVVAIVVLGPTVAPRYWPFVLGDEPALVRQDLARALVVTLLLTVAAFGDPARRFFPHRGPGPRRRR